MYFTYIMANRKHGTIYIGVTNDIIRRAYERREGLVPGFTRTHKWKLLVWYESHDRIENAITREKQIKKWLRPWKDRLIEEINPDWRDLWWEINGIDPQQRRSLS
jgi:putative endonuclease